MGLGGIIGSISPLSTIVQIGMGPAGWASLAARTLMSAVGQQVIQQLGQKLGLPQSVIDVAQAQFCAATGDAQGARLNMREAISQVSQDLNLTPSQQGQLSREVESGASSLFDMAMQNAINGNNSVGDAVNTRANAKGKGASWLERLAAVMSEAIESKMGDLEKLAKTAKNGATETNNFQVASQEFSLLMNTTTTAIKSIGEALGNMARKQ